MQLIEFISYLKQNTQYCVMLSPTGSHSNVSDINLSKIGGTPFWPKQSLFKKNKLKYPYDESGNPMRLLAQINFVDMPKLKPFPIDGIVQFYINNNHEYYGANFDDPLDNKNFKVLFIPYEEAIGPHDDSKLPELRFDGEYFPVDEPTRLSSNVKTHLDPEIYFDFEEMLEEKIKNEEERKEIMNFFDCYIVDGDRHQYGGFPTFIQHPPELYENNPKEWVTLLSLCSDNYINFGDYGIANFLIRKTDLGNLDFSKVAYTWDCT